MLVNLHYFLNLENTLVPRSLFEKMIAKGRYSYLRAITQMPASVSVTAPGKDWLILNYVCPDLISLIRDKDMPVLPSLFSHALPTLFPDSLPAQFEHGMQATAALFPHVNKCGIIPENDVSSLVVNSGRRYWQGIIHSVSHFRSAGQSRVKRIPGFWRLSSTEGSQQSDMPLLIISNDAARQSYLGMFREMNSISDTIYAMHTRNDDMLPETSAFLSDFERPWSNCTILSQETASPPRTDIWSRFHRNLKREEIMGFDYLDIIGQRTATSPLVELPSQSMKMWQCPHSQWLIKLQQETMNNNLLTGDYFELASLVACSCMPPRVLCRMLIKDEFPAFFKTKPGHVDFIGDVAKVHELLLICKNIRCRRKVSHNSHFLPSGSKTYLQLLDQALSHYAQEHQM